jgi:histidinol-phosphate aminotransferase
MLKVRKAVQEMNPYIPPTKERKGKLRLDFNENTLSSSPKVIQAIQNISEEDFTVYPEYSALREKIAEFTNLKKENIIVTNAGDEGIRNLMDSFVEENEEVILAIPSFAMFKFYAELRGAKITEISYNNDLSYPTEKMLKAINSKTNLVILCNPNNPTGTKIERKNIIKIIKKAEKNNCLILVDEAYFDISKETVIDLVNDYSNLVVLRSFSKGAGLAGLRIGFLASNKKIIDILLKAGSPYSISSLSVIAALASLKDKEFIDSYISEVIKAREFTLNEFKKLGIKTFPTNANFFLAEFNNPKKIVEKLKEKKILVRDRSNYPLIKNCIRIGIGTQKQMQYFISSLKEVLK